MQSDSHIHLDPSLQLWVLLPITIATLLMGLLRQNLSFITLREPQTTLAKIRDENRLKRAALLRQSGHQIPPSQFEARRFYFRDILHKDPSTSTMTALMNPESLANQVLSIILSLLPHMLLGTWARYSFAGVAVCRLPFSLTPRFRPMLQAGIEVAGRNLDVSYVSALSWYILNLFGNAGLLNILAGGAAGDPVFMPSVTSQISMNVAPDKVFESQRQAVLKAVHDCRVFDAEDTLLDVNPAEFATF